MKYYAYHFTFFQCSVLSRVTTSHSHCHSGSFSTFNLSKFSSKDQSSWPAYLLLLDIVLLLCFFIDQFFYWGVTIYNNIESFLLYLQRYLTSPSTSVSGSFCFLPFSAFVCPGDYLTLFPCILHESEVTWNLSLLSDSLFLAPHPTSSTQLQTNFSLFS